MRVSPSTNGAYRMSHGEVPPPIPIGESRPDNFLDSWKEIAAYLGREVRTVQRWEKKEGLPVHRQIHAKLGTVYAYKSEVDAWWKERSAKLGSKPENGEIAEGPRIVAWPFSYLTVLRLRTEFCAALFPPRINLGLVGVHGAQFFVDLPVNGEAFLLLPPLDSSHLPAEIRSNFFPRVQKIVWT